MKNRMKKKGFIILIALSILVAAIAVVGFSSKQTSFIRAITKSSKDLQYYDENTVFVLFTKYLDENQNVIAPTAVQTQTVDNLEYKVDIPQIDGYTPLVENLEGVLDQEGIEYLESLDYVKIVVKDNIYNIHITITYKSTPSAYTIVYYEQNTDLNGYTEIQRDLIGGTEGNYTGEVHTGDEINLELPEKQGFSINFEKTKYNGKVEAFGQTVFEIYYDRNSYYLYTFNTGDSYYEPIEIKYGQEINLKEEPSYSGYVFAGWEYSTTMDGEKIEKPQTMPDYNIYAEAQWTRSDTHYTLSYYTQNPNDDGYTNIGTVEISATSGDNLKDEDQTELKSFIENGFSTVRGDTAEYYYYNEEKTLTENNNFDIVVEGKGITVVPVYFDRHVYNITLDFNDSNYSTASEFVKNEETLTGSYTFQARLDQNLLEYWLIPDDVTVNPKSSNRTYYLRGWKADGNSSTYVSLRLTLTNDMIESDADSNRNITYYAQWSTSTSSRKLMYMFESFDQETTTTSSTRRLYNGKYYEEAEEYTQTVYTTSSMSAKDITGVSNVGSQTSGSTYYFYYDRDVLKITLYNMNNVHIEKELKYGQSLEEFIDEELNPEDFTLETPGTKDWIFEGWYQDSNYMMPMVWTNEDGNYKTITDNLVLYAKWSPPTYTVTFNTNGGTWTETDSRYVKVDDNTYTLTVEEGESLVRPSSPTRTGYVASVWNYEVNSTSVEYLFSDSQKVYSDLTLDLQYEANMNVPYRVRYIEAQYDANGELIKDVSQYQNIVELAPTKEVYNNAYGSTVVEYPIDIYDNENDDNYFVVDLRHNELKLISENIDDNEIYFMYAKNPAVSYTVYYVKYQEDADGNQIKYDYGEIPSDDVLLDKKENVVSSGYATEIAKDIEGWTVNGSYSQTIKLILTETLNTMYFYYNENETGEYLVNFFFMNENQEYNDTPDYTYTSQESAGKILYSTDFDKFTFENGATEFDYEGRILDTEKCGDAYLIVTTTSETSAMDIYFKNRGDLSYTVKYLEQDTNTELATSKTVNNQIFKTEVTEQALEIEGYDRLSEAEQTIEIKAEGNEIIFYYAKRTDLEYTVNYYLEGTTTKVKDSKIVTGQTFNSVITEDAIDIDGYNKIEPTTQQITMTTGDNIIDFYYTKRTDLSYTVKYLEQDTNTELATSKTVNNQTFKTEVTEQAIEIEGYDRVSEAEQTIEIEATGNEIIFYYTKRTDLSYTVKYLEQDTNTELAISKTVNNQTFKDTVTESAIDILGYTKQNPEETITIAISGNEIIFYYKKVEGLSYTVNYYEQGTENEVAQSKLVNGKTFEDVVVEFAIEIEGYNKVSPTEQQIIIGMGENIIDFYYTKRADLSYTVKYLEQDTNTELATSKTVNDQTFKTEVTEQAIEIEGYDRVSEAEQTIEIEVSGNEIIFYYTKRTDLSYTVKYLEQDTNTELATSKIVNNQIFKSEVTEQAIEIEGYDRLSEAEQTIEIEVSENEITFYYTKRTDLSYTVKYLEQDTNTELATSKTVNNQTFKTEVTEQAIEIEGYDRVSEAEQTIEIAVSGNEIIFYYTKKTDLSYTVKYLEQDTNTELATSKTVNNQTFKAEVTEQAIEIEGYDRVSEVEQTIEIEVSENEIIFYYTKRTDLSYTVKYLEQDTNTELATSKTVNNQTFKAEVTEQAIEIEGYDRISEAEQTIEIDATGNEIIFYYTKRTDLSYTVKYLEQDTNAELAISKTVNNQTFKDTVTESAIDILGYTKQNPEETITIAISGNEIIFYYKKVEGLSYKVNYYEQGTENEVAQGKLVNGKTFEDVVVEFAIEIEGYNKVSPTEQQIIIGMGENIIDFYYTKRTDLSYTVKYLEKDTNVELGAAKTVNNQTFKAEITEQAIEIEGYDRVSEAEQTIEMAVSGNEIIFYYTKRTDLSYTVKYLEKDTNVELGAAKTVNNQTFKTEVTEQAIEIDGYNKVLPTEQTIEIKTSGNEIVFYYTKRTDLSYKVEYYYDGVKDENKTETIKNQTFGTEILDYTEKMDSGYAFYETQNLPLIITTNENLNVIKVYYITDEGQTKELSYEVKYYKDGVLKESETEKIVVQYLKPDTMSVNKDKINTEDKYEGYYFLNTEPETIPDTITTGGVIKVNYTIRKDLSYTVKYLEKDTNVELGTSKTVNNQTFKTEVTEQAIEIEGYDRVSQAEQTIEIEVSENEIIFYYTKRADLSYTVKYINPTEGTVLKEEKVVNNQKFNDEITERALEIPGFSCVNPEKTIKITTGENLITFEYERRTDIEYSVEYYYANVLDEASTEKYQGTFESIVDGYKDKTIIGYEFDYVENVPLTISAYPEQNKIKVYYKKIKYLYTVNYYYDGYLNRVNTETGREEYNNIVDTYTDKIVEGYILDRTENFPLKISNDPYRNIISIHYTLKDSQIIVEYLDKETNAKLAEDTIANGKVYGTYNLENSKKEIDGYTISSGPEELRVEFKEEVQTFTFYYSKTANIIVKHLEKDNTESNEDNKVLGEEIIEGYVDLAYTTVPKDFENYVFAESSNNTSGKMTEEPIEIYYYYTRQLSGIQEKHIDVKSNEVLDSTYHEIPVGDYYKIDSKEFNGYDLVEEQLPENAEGTLTKEPIEVKYYYIRKTKVKTEYIDNETGKTIPEIIKVDEDGDGTLDKQETKDSTVILDGHEGDSYQTTIKEFEGYVLLENKLPENSEGTMMVTIDENGNVVTETVVRYYYAQETKVIEKHIDVKSNEVLEEKEHKGYVGKEYNTSPKEFEGYEFIVEQLPINVSGTMTKEVIEVNYYYIRKMTVRVEHINKKTGEIITENIEIDEDGDGNTDKTEERQIIDVIKGYEGDDYLTSAKDIEDYTLDKDSIPENANGIMQITLDENGEIVTEIVVKYYYLPKVLVIEKHIDIKTEKDIEPEKVHKGDIGQSYNIESKDYDNYDLVKESIPGNAEGVFQEETIIVKYYYIRKVKVTAEYINDITSQKIKEVIEVDEDEDGKPDKTEEIDSTVVIEGHEGDLYKTTPKEFEGYELVEEKVPENSEGTMGKENIYIRYYYLRKAKVIVEHIEKETEEKIPEAVEVDEDGDGNVDKITTKDSTEIINGQEGKEYKTAPKEFEGYDVIKEILPENSEGTMTVETITVKYYYIRKTKVIVEFIDEKTGEKIEEITEVDENGDGKPDKTERKDSTEIIEGHEGDSYKTTPKEFEDYEVIKEKLPENNEGTMTINPITVKYYYIKKAKVITEYIDVNTGEVIKDTISVDENGDGKPDNTEERDSTVIIKGYEGDSYKTTPKEFEGYDLVEEKLPENSEGVMTREPITVKYYYVREAKVIVEYIEEKTGEKFKETVEIDKDGDGKPDNTEEKDSTVLIEGHEGDSYKTTPKEFEGYKLIEEKIPENAEGEFEKDVITVKYYYRKIIKVITEHIDEKTGEKLKVMVEVDKNGDGKPDNTEEKDSTVVKEGHEGDKYEATPREFEKYDLVEEKLPNNSKGTIGENDITVKYYYIRKVTVTVEYIDAITGKTIKEMVEVDENGDGKPDKAEEKDSSIIINGHEGDHYKVTSKEFEGYDIIKDKLPENAEGTMSKDDINIKYYYLRKTKVIVEYINKDTGEKFKETIGVDSDGNGTVEKVEERDTTVVIEGHEGDKYTTTAKVFDGYKVIETTKNESGTMKTSLKADGSVETTTYVRYYYTERYAKVIVRYLERGTHKVLAEEIVKQGKPGEKYTTEAKTINLYTLEREPENKNGVMTEEDIIVTYYYYFTNPPQQPANPMNGNASGGSTSGGNSSNGNYSGGNTHGGNSNTIIIGDDSSTISTGDKVLVMYTSIIIFIVFVNILQIIISKRNKKDIEK